MKEQFFASDVVKITGVKLNRLQPWLERGYLKPSIEVASGHGTRNIYSRSDLYKIALFKKFVGRGISRKSVAEMINFEGMGEFVKGVELTSKRIEAATGYPQSAGGWLIIYRERVDGKEVTAVCAYQPGATNFLLNKGGSRKNPYDFTPHRSKDFIHTLIRDNFEAGGDDVLIINIYKIVKEIDAEIEKVTG